VGVLRELFTSEVGLASLAVIVITIIIGAYMGAHLRKLMKEKPGKEGWE
jgi:uncharacterized membrane protein YfcA